MRYMSSCSRWFSQGIALKTIMPIFVNFSFNWSYISCIRLILRLNVVIKLSLLLLSFLEALTYRSPLRYKDLYWARLTFSISPYQSSILLSGCQPRLLFYHHLHLPPPPLASSDSMALLSSKSKEKGHHIVCGRGRGRGHDGRPFPPCEHCRQTNHRSYRYWQKFGKPDWVANFYGCFFLFILGNNKYILRALSSSYEALGDTYSSSTSRFASCIDLRLK